jgi:hypothetical protein
MLLKLNSASMNLGQAVVTSRELTSYDAPSSPPGSEYSCHVSAEESELLLMAGIYQNSEVIPQLFYQALRAVMEGDMSPMLALWSTEEDVTYVDPAGQVHRGSDGIVTYWQQAVQRNAEASIDTLPHKCGRFFSGNAQPSGSR